MIGYYVHHQGAGHAARASLIARHLSRPLVGFGSLGRPDGWPGDWVALELDVPDAPHDPTAGGALHWAPLDHSGYRSRMAAIAGWLPHLDLMVVDVSAEVTLLARLMGVRTVAVAMRGSRTDRAHAAAYDAATGLLAPWGERFAEAWWPPRWTAKTVHAGAMSRFDGAPADTAADVQGPRRVLVVWGAGGTDLPDAALPEARRATPGWEWTWRSTNDPSPDLWRELGRADVVVCHGGNNAVAEVAAARRPAVVIAQPRPFDEQIHTVAAIRRGGVAVGLDRWPPAGQWPDLLTRATTLGGGRWAEWNRLDGAARAASAIHAWAGGHP